MSLVEHILYGLLWLSFGVLHSLLAGATGRALLAPIVGAWHRLAYNVVAVVHLAVVFGIGRFVLAADAEPYHRVPMVVGLQFLALTLAAFLLWAGARRYDLARFVGTRPERVGASPEPLIVDGMHAYLRHPLYAGGYLLLLGGIVDPFSLATAVWGAAYLAIGTWIEERRLVALYGERYVLYQRAVPALLPRLTPYRPE